MPTSDLSLIDSIFESTVGAHSKEYLNDFEIRSACRVLSSCLLALPAQLLRNSCATGCDSRTHESDLIRILPRIREAQAKNYCVGLVSRASAVGHFFSDCSAKQSAATGSLAAEDSVCSLLRISDVLNQTEKEGGPVLDSLPQKLQAINGVMSLLRQILRIDDLIYVQKVPKAPSSIESSRRDRVKQTNPEDSSSEDSSDSEEGK